MPDDRDRASASTIGPAVDSTIGADDAGGATMLGSEPTLAAPVAPVVVSDASIVGTEATLAPDAATTARTVGDELRAASIERFGEVARERFEALGELARGGLGRVSRARDPRTGRVVAIKEVLRPTPELIARFAREAMVTANLQHPAIVPVYEVGRWPSGEPYYAMKLVRGRALDAVIADAGTAEARLALIPHVIAIADALAYAHSERVIHRDLKPANVLIGPYGETVVIDWGLARNLGDRDPAASQPAAVGDEVPGQTVIGAVMGTPAYMPPEQAAGAPLDERADVYAIGAILYHVLAGVRPYAEARTADQVLAAVASGPPRALTELAPRTPRELAAIVAKAMASDARDRYPTAERLAEDLRRFQTGQLVGAHVYTRAERVARWARRHRAPVITAAIGLGALAIAATLGVRGIARERDRAQLERARAIGERTEADAARALAEQRVGDMAEELGRQAMVDGAPERALPLLIRAAIAQAAPATTARLMLGQAIAAFASLRGVAPARPAGITSADVTSDGRIVFTTAADTLEAWDVVRGTRPWSADGVARMAASPDGQWVIAAGATTVEVRAAADGRIARQLAVTANHPVAIEWAAASDRFAIGTREGTVMLGHRDRAEVITLAGDREIWRVALSPSGRRVLVLAADGVVSIHDTTSGARTARLRDGAITSVDAAWLDDDQVVTADGDRQARRWQVETARPIARYPHGAALIGVTVDPRGGWAVTYAYDATVKLWDLATDALRAELPGHRTGVDVAAAIDGLLVTADEPGRLYLWDPSTGDPIGGLPTEEPAPTLVVRGRQLLTWGSGRPRVWQLAPDVPLRRVVGHTARVRDLAFTAGGVVWSASNDGSARGVVVATGEVHVAGAGGFVEPPVRDASDPAASAAPNPRGIRALAPADDQVAIAGEDGTIAIVDATTGAPRASWRQPGRARALAWSRDRRALFSVGDDKVRRWDPATGQLVAEADVGGVGWDVAVVDAGTIATVTEGQVLTWRDATTLAPRLDLPQRPSVTRTLARIDDRLVVGEPTTLVAIDATGAVIAQQATARPFAIAVAPPSPPPQPRLIAVVDTVGTITLRDAVSLAAVRSWPTGAMVLDMQFRPDGAVLAITAGRRVQLWDPARGRLLATSPELPVVLTRIAWSPDGETLAIAGGGGTIWLWQLAPGDVATAPGFAQCVAPWRLDGSQLVAAPLTPGACAVLAK